MTTSSKASLVIGAICTLGFIVRVVGLQYGLPAVYNPDEVAIMARALSFARGTLNPHNFLYPTLYFYALFAWVGVYLGWIYITGQVASLTALHQLYFNSPQRTFQFRYRARSDNRRRNCRIGQKPR